MQSFPSGTPRWLPLLGLLMCTSSMSQVPVPAPPKDRGLCLPEEDVIFACRLQSRRVVSACASPSLDASQGHLQYRFGKPGKVEMTLPRAKDDPAWRQTVVAKRLWYSAGGGNYLRFNQPPFSYVVYRAFGARWGEKAGVMVWKNGEMVDQHPCTGAPFSQMGPAFQSRAGLGGDPDEVVLP